MLLLDSKESSRLSMSLKKFRNASPMLKGRRLVLALLFTEALLLLILLLFLFESPCFSSSYSF